MNIVAVDSNGNVKSGIEMMEMISILKSLEKLKTGPKTVDDLMQTGVVAVLEEFTSYNGQGIDVKVKGKSKDLAVLLSRGEIGQATSKDGVVFNVGFSFMGQLVVQTSPLTFESTDALTKDDERKGEDYNIKKWLEAGERGRSSESIVSQLASNKEILNGLDLDSGAYPRDPADFRRCVLLLDAVPEFKPKFEEMANVSKEWEVLISNWPRLEALYDVEKNLKSAPVLYAEMQKLLMETMLQGVKANNSPKV